MAINPLPDAIKVRNGSFRFIDTANISRTLGRAVDAEVVPYPYWTADYDLVPLEDEDFGRYESFLIKHRVGRNHFLAYKTYRPRPLRMDAGVPLTGVKAIGGAFDGTAAMDAVIDSLNVTISGLPANFELIEGDMVDFQENADIRTLHMIGADATADANGVVSIVLDNPIYNNIITTAATVNFEKASCLMQINEQPDQQRGVRFGSGSFNGVEIPV